MRKIFFLVLLLLVLSSCGGVEESISPYDTSFYYEKTSDKVINLDLEDREFYDNKFLEDRIPNQWPSYGIGDPFVYRFNGKYYLYCSTKDHYVGVKAWVSSDMMDWTPVTGEGLEYGFVCQDPSTVSAYAPEVIYRDGYFYMCQSSGGNGHYLYRALKPEGPFIRITDNIGDSIDGSFFIDDDEVMYFSRASSDGIIIKKFNEEKLCMEGYDVIDASFMNGWTEGSYILKRDGMYYLTYTGNHIMSNGYRVSYSYATKEEFENNYAFNKGDVLLINTDNDFKGLGHSSTVMGPDLDSYYIAYHNLINTIPTRNFNLARLSFNGSNMRADTCSIYDNYAPRLPLFSSEGKEGLLEKDNLYLNDVLSTDIFSAEFNFIGDNANLYFSYLDNENYNYINVNNNVISVYQVLNNSEKLISSVKLNRKYDYTKLHTIRLAYNDTLDIYFDNMRKINDLEIECSNGYIGYSDNIEIYYTALTDVAKGSSDSKEIHQNNFSLKDYAYSNTDIKLNDGFYPGSKNIVLEKDNVVSYPIFINEAGNHDFDLMFKKDYAGKKVKFRIDNGDYIVVRLPDVKNNSSEYIKATIFNQNLKCGLHTLTIVGIDSIEVMELSINYVEEILDTYSYNLDNEEELNYISEWVISNDGHAAKAVDRNVLYIPFDNLKNCVVEVDVMLLANTNKNSAVGIVLRADNAGLYQTENDTGIQGYFCGFNSYSVFISKYNYEYSQKFVAEEKVLHKSGEMHHLKAIIKDNNIIFDFDNGKYILEYNDPLKYSTGNFGLYADDANAVFKNLKVYPIK